MEQPAAARTSVMAKFDCAAAGRFTGRISDLDKAIEGGQVSPSVPSRSAVSVAVLCLVLGGRLDLLQPIYDEINEKYGTNEKPGD